MGGSVVRSEISLHFNDAADALDATIAMDKVFAEEIPGYGNRVAVIELARKFVHGALLTPIMARMRSSCDGVI
jgi:hypothetical protein